MDKFPTPSSPIASYTPTSTTITWGASTSAYAYKIIRNNQWISTVTTTSYTDSSAGSGTSFTYLIIATNSSGGNLVPQLTLYPSTTLYPYGSSGEGDSDPAIITTANPATLDSPVVYSTTQTGATVTLNWYQVPNATYYTVQRGNGPVMTVTSLSYTDNNVLPNQSYTYTIIAHAPYLYDSAPTVYTVSIDAMQATPTISVIAQTTDSVTLQINRQQNSGTMVLWKDGVELITYTPTGTNVWTYTDTGLIDTQTYVYSTQTLADASYNASFIASVPVYLGHDYTNIERQIAYLTMLKRPYTKLCRLRFLYPNGATAFALDNNPRNKRSKAFVADGSVNANMQNGQRITATVTIANADHVYDFDINKIWFGQEIAIEEGLVLPNGEEYWRQTGEFIIDNPQETVNPNTKTVTYNLVDKWADLDGTLDGNLEGTHEVPVNTNIFTPIVALLSENRGNGRPVDRMNPVFTEYFNSRTQELPDGSTASMVLSPYTLVVDGDGGTIGTVVLGLGGMINAWVGYDNTGRLRIEPSQDDILDAQKAVLYRFTQDEVTLLGLAYTVKKEEVYNDYIVVGEQFDDYSQPGGRAQNLDPRSDTNVNIIGRKTLRESASGYATSQQCMDLAEWRLKRSGILQKAVNISCQQMFHIELNSLVEVVRADKPGAPTERHLIQGYSRPLASNGNMTITAVSVNDFPVATVTEWPPVEE